MKTLSLAFVLLALPVLGLTCGGAEPHSSWSDFYSVLDFDPDSTLKSRAPHMIAFLNVDYQSGKPYRVVREKKGNDLRDFLKKLNASFFDAKIPLYLVTSRSPFTHSNQLLNQVSASLIAGEVDAAKEKIEGVLASEIDKLDSEVFISLKNLVYRISNGERVGIRSFDYSRKFRWGSCYSNSFESIGWYVDKVSTDKDLTIKEKVYLVNARLDLSDACGDQAELVEYIKKLAITKESASSIFTINTAAANYLSYLDGAAHLYVKDYSTASSLFSQLAKNTGALKEVSLYLTTRLLLLDAQKKWHGYARINDGLINRELLDLAYKSGVHYIESYPRGKYRKSTEGFIRRIHYLSGDNEKYVSQLKVSIRDEVGSIIAQNVWTEESFLSIESLYNEYNLHVAQSSDKTNEMFVNLFKPYADKNGEVSSGFLRVVKFTENNQKYKQKEYVQVVAAYEGEANLIEPELVLYTRALAAKGEVDLAIKVWGDLSEFSSVGKLNADYEINKLIVKNKGVSNLFVNEWATNDNLKSIYLAGECSTDLQKELLYQKNISLSDRHIIFIDLAARYLYSGDFMALNDLIESQEAQVVGEYDAIQTAVSRIVEKEDLGAAYLNIAYFMQKRMPKVLVHLPRLLETNNNTVRPCQTAAVKNSGKGPVYYYYLATKNFGESKSIAEAKTLHYIATCNKSSSGCNWGVKPENAMSSKVAFQKLHAKYAGDKWATKTKYYY